MRRNPPPRTAVRNGRMAFAAHQDDIKAALDRGEWMSAIYEERRDKLPFSYTQFTKHVRRVFGPNAAEANGPSAPDPPMPAPPMARPPAPHEPLQQVRDDRPKRFKMTPKRDDELF